MLANIERPRTLKQVIGQDTIVKTIYNAFKNDNLANVIFLIGNSGTGKNTIANIISMMLLCTNPDENHNPCGVCSSCRDIIEEKNQSVHIYSGADLTADALKSIEDELMYSPLMEQKRVYIFNEAQQSSVLRRLLEIIEQQYINTYFIITSTDKTKFSNTGGKSNKENETQALRSRGCYLNLKSISTKQISDYLFGLLSKFDPEEKIPDTFINEGLMTIAENANGNIRLAINDFSTILNAEIWTTKEIISLLGYQDTTNYMNYLLQLCSNNNTVLNDIHELGEDTYGFFIYCWKVLTEIQLRHILGKPFDEEYKERNYLQLINLSEFKSVYKMFILLGKEIGNNYYNGNFNNILLGSLMELVLTFKIQPEGVKRKTLPVRKINGT